MKLTSPAFEDGEEIPSKYTCDGEDISPELLIQEVPKNTESLVLIVDDPDAPGKTWIHWVVYNIPVIDKIEEDSIPEGEQGINDFKKTSYGGPCPPKGVHRYKFKLYALDTKLELDGGSEKQEVVEAMEGHVLQKAVLTGNYSRK